MKHDDNYLVLLHSTWQEMVLDLNLLCSWAWNQIFILVVDTTGYLSVGLWFLQYLVFGQIFSQLRVFVKTSLASSH